MQALDLHAASAMIPTVIIVILRPEVDVLAVNQAMFLQNIANA